MTTMVNIDYSSFEFKRGVEDYSAGKKPSDNPYLSSNPSKAFQWNAGYRDAKRNFEKQRRKKNWI